jgi:hypothetical protein
MRTRICKAVLVFFVVIAAIVTTAIPVPVLSVSDLMERSDLIVVGSVVFVQEVGASTVEIGARSVKAHEMQCTVQLYGTLKGTTDGRELSFRYSLPEEPIGYATISAPSYEIIFLKKGENGYSLTDPYYPSLPAIPGTAVTDGNTDTLGGITLHLDAVVRSTTAPPAQRQRALYALSTIGGSQSTGALQAGLVQSDQALRLNAAAYLLQRNNLSGLKAAEVALLTPPDDVPRYVLHNLAYGISEGVKDPVAVPSLKKLLHVEDVETRRAAASALWHVGTKSAEGPLASALNDPDLAVRYQAVWGLAQMAGQTAWAPNLEVFRAHEAKYVKHWHEWAATGTQR